MRLEKGSKAPPFEAVDAFGNIWRIPEALKGKPLVLLFMRHLGCPLCKMRIDELRADYTQFQAAGAEILVILESTGPRVEKYTQSKSIPYSIVGNKDKSIYDLYGVKRGGARAFMAPRVLKESARATLRGYFHGRIEGDELQKPAQFIISPDGSIAWAHYGKDISDTSSNETLLRQLEALG